MSMNPTNISWPLKNCSIISSKNKPIITAGIIEIMIFSANIFSSFIFFVKTPFNILSMSFLNMNKVLSAVAKCKTTVITKLSLAS